MKTVLIIPALNEQEAIGGVLDALPPGVYAEVLVVDNGSEDRTAEVAAAHGARVLSEPRRGYGNACLRAIAALPPDTGIVVFMDADGSDVPPEVLSLLAPIEAGEADLVLGSRVLGQSESGALSPHQRFGNWLATSLMALRHGHKFTDLGPFRAITAASLASLDMKDGNYGWTIEMQLKALRQKLRVQEIPVTYRRRQAGQSKVSGNLAGSVKAGAKILWTFARLSVT